jgi:hypothetical protein
MSWRMIRFRASADLRSSGRLRAVLGHHIMPASEAAVDTSRRRRAIGSPLTAFDAIIEAFK